MRPEAFQRALFVGAHQTRITRDIRSENSGEPTLHDNPLPREDQSAIRQSYERALSNNQPVGGWEGHRCNRAWPALPAMQALVVPNCDNLTTRLRGHERARRLLRGRQCHALK
jgi:hypothetical protein